MTILPFKYCGFLWSRWKLQRLLQLLEWRGFHRPCMPCGTAFERWYPYCYQSNHQVTNEVSKILSGQDRKSLMALSAWLCCDMNLRKFSEEVACVGPVRGHHGSWLVCGEKRIGAPEHLEHILGKRAKILNIVILPFLEQKLFDTEISVPLDVPGYYGFYMVL